MNILKKKKNFQACIIELQNLYRGLSEPLLADNKNMLR